MLHFQNIIPAWTQYLNTLSFLACIQLSFSHVIDVTATNSHFVNIFCLINLSRGDGDQHLLCGPWTHTTKKCWKRPFRIPLWWCFMFASHHYYGAPIYMVIVCQPKQNPTFGCNEIVLWSRGCQIIHESHWNVFYSKDSFMMLKKEKNVPCGRRYVFQIIN